MTEQISHDNADHHLHWDGPASAPGRARNQSAHER
jgi:hypothetical protein